MTRWFNSLSIFIVCALLFVGCAYGKHLKSGDTAYAAGDYEAALVSYQAAAAVDPASTEAANKVELATTKVVEGYAAEAATSLQNDDLLGALVIARKSWKRFPDAPATQSVVRDVSNATVAKAQKLRNENDFANALMLYDALGETLPSEADKVAPLAADIKATWSAQLRDKATKAYDAGRKGDALLLYAKVAQLTSEPTDGGRRDQVRNELLKEWAYWVQLSGGRGEAYENVVIGLSGVTPNTTLRIGERLPPDTKRSATAKFTLGPPKFSTDRTSRTDSVQYQSGTKLVENPFYKSKQDRVLDEERRLVDAQNDVTNYENDVSRYQEAVAREGDTPGVSTGAEQSLSNAKSRLESARNKVQDQRNAVMRAKEELAREQPMKEEPVYSEHRFEVTTHTRRGELELDVRIRPDDGRPEVRAQDVARIEASDDAYPAQPIANVAADPLNLPGDHELAAQLYSQVVAKSRALIASSFAQWRTALVERALAAPTDDQRVDLMVIYILTDPNNVTPKVPADLSALRGIPDSVKLLNP